MPTKGQTIAEGAYIRTHGQETVGRETWQLTKLAHTGLLFTCRAEVAKPRRVSWNLTYDVTQQWMPAAFTIHVDAGDQSLVGVQRVEKSSYVARVEPRGGEAKTFTLDLAKRQIDFDSPIFKAVTLVRLNLQVGQSSEFETIFVTLPGLEPRVVKQKYTCAAEEKIEVPAGVYSAWHYTVVTEAADGGASDGPTEAHLWADRHGVVLLSRPEAESEVRLARYRRIERR